MALGFGSGLALGLGLGLELGFGLEPQARPEAPMHGPSTRPDDDDGHDAVHHAHLRRVNARAAYGYGYGYGYGWGPRVRVRHQHCAEREQQSPLGVEERAEVVEQVVDGRGAACTCAPLRGQGRVHGSRPAPPRRGARCAAAAREASGGLLQAAARCGVRPERVFRRLPSQSAVSS